MIVGVRLEFDASDDEHAEELLDVVLLALADNGIGDAEVTEAVAYEQNVDGAPMRLICEAARSRSDDAAAEETT